jgi:glycosyltransferase involved in cell wall biosynthesis
MRILIISFVFPPCTTGAGTVMYNLCRYLPKDCYNVITSDKEFCMRWGVYDKDYELDANIARLPVRTTSLLDLLLFFVLTVFKGLSANKKKRFDCIFAVHPYFYDLLAAHILHRLTKKPFVIYMHDLYSETKKNALTYRIWVYLEKKVLSSASKILVMNERYQKHYANRGIHNTTIFPPSIDLQYYNERGKSSHVLRAPADMLNIAYTGSVYGPQKDAVFAFLEAAEKAGEVHVTFATPTAKGYLKDSLKEYLKDVNVGFLPKKECNELQRSADVLFLPLSPNFPYQEEVEVAFPCKLLEYLAAGKAVLAVVPRGSFVESFVKKYEIGLVVNELSVEKIVSAINELKDKNRRTRFSRNALSSAQLFDSRVWAKKLCLLLNKIVVNDKHSTLAYKSRN